MTAKPGGRILVVTPTLGESEYLSATVASVAAQRASILHVIVAPAAKVGALRARFPRAYVVADPGKLGGVYGALNAGLAAASNVAGVADPGLDSGRQEDVARLADSVVGQIVHDPDESHRHSVCWSRDVPVALSAVSPARKTHGAATSSSRISRPATGGWDWFTYINDDDVLLPGLSEALKRHVESGATEEVLYGDVDLIDSDSRRVSSITIERSPEWIPALLQEQVSPLMQQGMLFRRDVVERLREFDTRYRLCADLDFWLRAYVGGAKFRYYATRVGQFRLRSGQLSGATVITEREQAEIVHRHLPATVPWWRRWVARWRYRWLNLPRYFERIRARGLRTSYQLLNQEAVSSGRRPCLPTQIGTHSRQAGTPAATPSK